MSNDHHYKGSSGDGMARIEDADNPDAWIEASYREGWVKRKLMVADTTPYEEMIEPFYLKCQSCHRHKSPQCWGAGSPHCPACEQQMEYNIPRAIAWIFDDEEPSPPPIDDI